MTLETLDAVELANAAGTVRFYASDLVDADIPPSIADGALAPAAALGPPPLIDSEAPYVVSLNGGWVIVAIDTLGIAPGDDWQVRVYEVDGMLYENGAPEPYGVSISTSPEGPWKELGVGSGVARFSLDGGSRVLSEEQRREIARIVAKTDPEQRLVGPLQTVVDKEQTRIQAIGSADQLVAEILAYLAYYEKLEHHVIGHGEVDDGSLQAAARLLAVLDARWRHLAGSQ